MMFFVVRKYHWTDGPTDRRTRPLIEMRSRIWKGFSQVYWVHARGKTKSNFHFYSLKDSNMNIYEVSLKVTERTALGSILFGSHCAYGHQLLRRETLKSLARLIPKALAFFLRWSSYIAFLFFSTTFFFIFYHLKTEVVTLYRWTSFCAKTSRTEFGKQMRSGDLLSYLSMNCLLNGGISCSRCYFVRIQSISQKFNSCVTDRRTDRRTDRHTLL